MQNLLALYKNIDKALTSINLSLLDDLIDALNGLFNGGGEPAPAPVYVDTTK